MNRLNEGLQHVLEGVLRPEEANRLGLEYRPSLNLDHGIIGALHLLSLIERIVKDEPWLKVEDFLPAVTAIAKHNVRRREDRIEFDREPLAFLLALCDQVQEWRRPRLSFAVAPQFLSALLGGTEIGGNLAGPFEVMELNIQATIQPDDAKNRNLDLRFVHDGNRDRAQLTVTLKFDGRINRNSAVFSMWLDSTLNFQRLDFGDLPLDVTVIYDTPMYRHHDGHFESQLHRLRNAAHETHMNFLADWFPDRREPSGGSPADAISVHTNGAVGHEMDLGKHREKLSLNVRRLGSRALMTRAMDAFWERLPSWKDFNDDRDYLGDYSVSIPE